VQHQFDALARSEPLPRLKAMNGLDKVSRALRTLVDLEEQRTTSPMRIRSRRAGEIVFTVALNAGPPR
jgi:hypothetical protein